MKLYSCFFRCREKCNLNHENKCGRGILPDNFCCCHTAVTALKDSTLTYITFETSEVETHGKGKPYTRVEKVGSELQLEEFVAKLRDEFKIYSQHIIAAWYLRSTKLQLFSLSPARSAILTIGSDFGEAFLVVSKHETADQFFKRREVNLHGSVCDFLITKEGADQDQTTLEAYSMSYIVSSDCKLVISKHYWAKIM